MLIPSKLQNLRILYHIYIKMRRVVQLIQVLRHRIAPFRVLHGYDGIIRSYSLIPQLPGLFPGAASPAYALMSTRIKFKICRIIGGTRISGRVE
jgi:hypothetical protein